MGLKQPTTAVAGLVEVSALIADAPVQALLDELMRVERHEELAPLVRCIACVKSMNKKRTVHSRHRADRFA